MQETIESPENKKKEISTDKEKSSADKEAAFEPLTMDMLPTVTGRYLERAHMEDMIEWAKGMHAHYGHGLLHMDSQHGFILQILKPQTIRVIQAWDSISSLSMLSQTLESFRKAGFSVEVDGYAHLTPMSTGTGDSDAKGLKKSSTEACEGSEENPPSIDKSPDAGAQVATATISDVGMWC